MNLPVCAVSVITDLCTPEALEQVTIEKVLAAAAQAEPKLTRLLTKLVNV
jgi:purine-nucleoside phosphorylase